MLYHSQNLSKRNSIFWHGRAWLHTLREARIEWSFFKFANSFHFKAVFGTGDSQNGITLMLGIPLLFDLYITVLGLCPYMKVERETGIAIHGSSFWLYPWANRNEWNSRDSWWARSLCWNFPWQLDWYSTEVLDQPSYAHSASCVVWKESKLSRKGKCPFDGMKEKDAAVALVVMSQPYRYQLKSGKIQNVAADFFVERMEHRARWWPLIPSRTVRTFIDVKFSAEVGEGEGSWKGGCTGCGYTMLPGETPLQTLKRMERERKFNR